MVPVLIDDPLSSHCREVIEPLDTVPGVAVKVEPVCPLDGETLG